MHTWRLGLIGGNITASRSPLLQGLCALSVGGNASYDLLIPAEWGMTFAQMLEHCERAGFHGVNVTYPFKEKAAALVPPGDPIVAALGAANTVLFTPQGPRAFNTDHSGFIAAWAARFGNRAPGRVLILGAGGVGRAVGFALAGLGASALVLHDSDAAKARALSQALRRQFPGLTVTEGPADLAGCDGVVNGTPLGMAGRPGSPLPPGAAGGPDWAFDAVYTPPDTPFRAQVLALGADFLPGHDLYLHQGVQAFEIFAGRIPDLAFVRRVIDGHS